MQLKDAVLKEYYTANLSENTHCPSVRELVRKFNTSKVTIDKVFKELKKDNLIYSVPGLGTFWGKKKNIVHTRTVGICLNATGEINRISSPYFFSMLEGIEEVFSENDFNIKLLRPGNLNTIDSIRDAHCDAFMCTGKRHSILSVIDNFKKLYIPYLILDRPDNDETLNYLERDSARNVQELVDYVFFRGHRKICAVGLEPTLWVYKKFFIGFEDGMRKHNLDFSHSELELPDYNYDSIEWGNLKDIIRQHTALIILSPRRAFAETILEYCNRNNIKIPSDCSVVRLASDDLATGDQIVTSHMITSYEMGVKAAEGIVTLLNNTAQTPLHITFPLKIIEGNTLKNNTE
jgi:DNA-binding LacI/PurR family transcriptional regulator